MSEDGAGAVRTVVAEQGGRILIRVLVRLLVGFGYVMLVEWVRLRLWDTPEVAS